MKFKVGEKVIRNSDRLGNIFELNKVYTVEKWNSKTDMKLKEIDTYTFMPQFFVSAEPELFHQQLENLTK